MKKYDGCSDEELIRMLRENNPEIEDYLINKYKGLVLTKARTLYLIGGETDDLIQEGMIGLFKAVRDFQEKKGASFSTFANLCIDRQMYYAIQASNRQKHIPLNTYVSLSGEGEEPTAQQIPLWQTNPESIVIDKENVRLIQEQIRGLLSPLEREVLDRYLEGEDYVQIASKLEKSPKSIDNAIQRMRQKVKDFLDKTY